MAKLTNRTKRDIDLPSRHVIPRLGELTLPNETIRSVDNWPRVNGLVLSGDLAVEFDPEPSLDDPEKTVTEVIQAPEVDHPGDPVKVKVKHAKP